MSWTSLRTTRRRTAGILLAVALLFASAAAPAGSQAGNPVLGDGQWRVVFFIEQAAVLGGINIEYRGHGSSLIAMNGGNATGEWNLSLTTVVTATTATSNGVAIGTVSGNGVEQTLDFTSMTVTDATFGVTVTFTADELPVSGGGTLRPLGRGCSAITGVWFIPFNDQTLEGTFIAQRLGAGGGETDADLRDNGLALIEDARNGTINVGALRDFVAQAERGSEATARDSGCGSDTARIFGNAATMLLNSVLVEAGYATEDLSDADFMEFYRVALRSGLYEMYPDTYLTWEFALLNRLADAIRSDDIAVWRFWLPIARQLGEDEAAIELATRICMEEGHFGCDRFSR